MLRKKAEEEQKKAEVAKSLIQGSQIRTFEVPKLEKIAEGQESEEDEDEEEQRQVPKSVITNGNIAGSVRLPGKNPVSTSTGNSQNQAKISANGFTGSDPLNFVAPSSTTQPSKLSSLSIYI